MALYSTISPISLGEIVLQERLGAQQNCAPNHDVVDFFLFFVEAIIIIIIERIFISNKRYVYFKAFYLQIFI